MHGLPQGREEGIVVEDLCSSTRRRTRAVVGAVRSGRGAAAGWSNERCDGRSPRTVEERLHVDRLRRRVGPAARVVALIAHAGSAFDGVENDGCGAGASAATRTARRAVAWASVEAAGWNAAGCEWTEPAAEVQERGFAGASGSRAKSFGQGRDLDVTRLGPHARRRGRTAAQRGEVGLERANAAIAVVGLEARERLDVGEQRVAPGREVEDLLFEAAAFGFAAPAGVGFGVGDQPARLDLGVVDHLAGLGLGLVHRLVGRALREQQRAVQDVFGLARVPGLRLRGVQALAHLLDALVGGVEGRGRPFEQLVHLVAAVAPEGFTDLDVAELARCDFHASTVDPHFAAIGASPAASTRALRAVGAQQMTPRRTYRITISTRNERSNMPAGGMTRRSGARTGSVRSSRIR